MGTGMSSSSTELAILAPGSLTTPSERELQSTRELRSGELENGLGLYSWEMGTDPAIMEQWLDDTLYFPDEYEY